MNISTLTLLLFTLYCQIKTGISILHPDGYEYEECPPENKKCEFWLVVQEHLTMIYEKNLVYAHKGNLYLYNEHHSNFTTHVSVINLRKLIFTFLSVTREN